jgi:apolipoprotein N-acyltransferase
MSFRVTAYPEPARMLAAVLTAVGRASPLVLLVLAWTFPDAGLDNPLVLLRAFALACLLPLGLAWLLALAYAATVEVAGDDLVVLERARRVEVPRAAIERVEPWTIPLPSNGVTIRLRSGRVLDRGLALADPDALAAALGRTDDAAAHGPAAAFAAAKRAWHPPWHRPLLQYGLFGLVPTLPLFRLHQWIAYGGTFGEYYVYGLGAYLLGFAIYWAGTAAYLVMYAAVLRAIAEAVALAAAWAAPTSAPGARRAVEWGYRLLFYGGVPALLAIRFLQP